MKLPEKKVFIFIDGICLHTGNDIFIAKFVDDILDVKLLCTAGFCALFKSVKFLLLSAVNTDTDDLIVKVFL